MRFSRTFSLVAAALAAFAFNGPADAQTANGKATTAAPVYSNGVAAPLSLDTVGNLRVNCITGCAGGGSGGNVNITGVGGNTVTTAVPVSGTVGISGTVPVSGTVGVSGTVTTAGTSTVSGTVAVSTLPALVAGSAIVGNVRIDQTTPGTTNGVAINAALPTGTNAIGSVVAVPSTVPLTLNSSAILAASTNATLVKASAGIVTEISVYNSSATLAWLKLYNAASAPTCGSGTPVGRYLIPGAASGGAGSNVSIDLGKAFTTGIAYCVTGLLADADTTATAAGTMSVNLTYK